MSLPPSALSEPTDFLHLSFCDIFAHCHRHCGYAWISEMDPFWNAKVKYKEAECLNAWCVVRRMLSSPVLVELQQWSEWNTFGTQALLNRHFWDCCDKDLFVEMMQVQENDTMSLICKWVTEKSLTGETFSMDRNLILIVKDKSEMALFWVKPQCTSALTFIWPSLYFYLMICSFWADGLIVPD